VKKGREPELQEAGEVRPTEVESLERIIKSYWSNAGGGGERYFKNGEVNAGR